MNKSRFILPNVEQFCQNLVQESEAAKQLRIETAELPEAHMQITVDQGAFLAFLIKLLHAKNVLELGTFMGYSALVMAEALPPFGKLITCDLNAQRTEIARKYWRLASVQYQIELRIGKASDTLKNMFKEGLRNFFDLAFIDADKQGVDEYYEMCLSLVRPEGLIIIDNALWQGEVVNSESDDPTAKIMQALNQKVKKDSRVNFSILSIGDGMLLIWKKPKKF